MTLTVISKYVSQPIKKALPGPVKHPLLEFTLWNWRRRGLPAQSPQDISIFKAILSEVGDNSVRVFEWGSGFSTIYYSRFLRDLGRQFDWYAIDNSPKWHQRVRAKVAQADLVNEVSLYCSVFPAFWELPSYSPADPVPPESYANGVSALDYVNMPIKVGGQFDVIIIDGRLRRRCLLVVAEALAPRGIVLLHDAGREHYHSSPSSYGFTEFVDTGMMPGLRAKSSIALCSIDSPSFINELAKKYGPRSKSR